MTGLRISTGLPILKSYLYIVVLFWVFIITTNLFLARSDNSDNKDGIIITASVIGVIALLAA